LVNFYLKDYEQYFNDTYTKFTFNTEDGYIINYKFISNSKNFIYLKCSETNCEINAKFNLLNNELSGFPDPNGNIIKIEKINKKFITENQNLFI
jgi:hypothetical protein